MSTTTLWTTMAVAGLVTYLLRLSLIELAGRFGVPERLTRVLRHVAPAALAALTMPVLLDARQLFAGTWDWRVPVAGLAASLIAFRTRRTMPTLVAGFGVLVLLQLVRPG